MDLCTCLRRADIRTLGCPILARSVRKGGTRTRAVSDAGCARFSPVLRDMGSSRAREH